MSDETTSIPQSARRINRLAQFRNAKFYLEIGVSQGDTFKYVHILNRAGIDPNFQFDIAEYKDDPDTNLYPITSDAFFTNLKNSISVRPTNQTWDIIYIDGMHTFEQSLRDFTNSIPYSNNDTIWIFDDTIPMDAYTSIPNQDKARHLRKLCGLTPGPWHGDVYKTIFALHDFFPYFSYATVIDSGNPQTIVWHTDLPSRRNPMHLTREEIKNMNYFDMLENCSCLNLISDSMLLNEIGTNYNNTPCSSTSLLSKIVHKIW